MVWVDKFKCKLFDQVGTKTALKINTAHGCNRQQSGETKMNCFHAYTSKFSTHSLYKRE
jgi:hypothetical protein